ncbi:MAG: ATP-binding cassette domain-containing protein, partial [Candidatus Taylorbacteria bacterium]|nr:ATP-binding cassette domain-containing protein [Candidatus Taylorbacteria bacterium]
MIDRDKIPKNFAGQETIIRFEDVSFEHGPNQPILDEVSFTVRKSTKITIMGQNGAGKTTLFGLILGDYTPESGEIHISNDASIATARQVIPRPDLELTVREFFAKCFKEKVYDIDPRIDEVLKIVSLNVPKVKSSPARAAPLRQGFEGQANDKGVPTFSKKNEGTLLSSRGDGGIDRHAFMDVKDRLVKTFSGGQQARFLLASALIQDPGILLLDEPTNNLDKAGIEHLTQFLVNYKKTCLVISHDAEFLNAFTHGVLYLDVHTRKVEQYVGDYK